KLANWQPKALGDTITPAVDANLTPLLECKPKAEEDQEQAHQTDGLLDPGEIGGECAPNLARHHVDEIECDHDQKDRHNGDSFHDPQSIERFHAALLRGSAPLSGA